jgi:hypothetical protein
VTSISAVRDGLQTRLASISGMHAYDLVPGAIQLPAAIVEPDEPVILFDSTMGRGSDELFFSVLLLALEGTLRTGQDKLDAYLATSGADSVKAAIEGDPTLGGIVSFAHVTSAEGYGEYTFNELSYVGVKFKVQVTT